MIKEAKASVSSQQGTISNQYDTALYCMLNIESLKNQMSNLKEEANEAKQKVPESIKELMSQFQEYLLEHMSKEESQLLEVLPKNLELSSKIMEIKI